ncbi:MAG TPA: hypothetical protein VFD92_10845 [Candidatus Binatia bacterium]|nr:hypothetical protein [Candidatus Binatia bacterium]
MVVVGVSAFAQPSLQRVVFDASQPWFLAFGAVVVAMLLWLLLGSLHRSFGLHRIACPRAGEHAFVVVRKRARSGAATVIEACSLSHGRRLTCGTPCAKQIARA